MARILIAEDNEHQASLLKAYLVHEGHSVVAVTDGLAAIDEARARRPDLIVLDSMMPGISGLDACRLLRADSDVPIMMVTAKGTEDDVLEGLDLGADDYVIKPYSPRELMARIRTLLRRTDADTKGENKFTVGDLLIDHGRRAVAVRGEPVELTPREFSLLAALSTAPGKAFTRRELLDRAVGFDHYVLERTVDMHLLNLRKKIEDDPSQPRYVLTVKGHGYRLAEA